MEANNKALREALVAARDLILPHCNGGTAFAKACGEVVNKIMSALAEPPRNCDRFASGNVEKDADDALRAILDEGVAGYRSIAEYLLSPIAEKGATDAVANNS